MQNDVDELVEIVHDNMDQAMQRHGKLKDLNVIAGNLERGAGEFKTSSNEVKRKKWRKYMKARIICMGIAVILIIILIGELYSYDSIFFLNLFLYFF